MTATQFQYLSSFINVCRLVNSSLEITEVLKAITESATSALEAKACAIFLVDKVNKRLKIGSYHGLSQSYLDKGPLDTEKSIVETLNGRWVMVPDATRDERIQYPQEAGEEGIATILSVPMAIRGAVIGVLRIYTSEPRQFSDIENEFISGLSEIGSVAIENARMYSHLKQDHEKLISDVHQWFDFGSATHDFYKR